MDKIFVEIAFKLYLNYLLQKYILSCLFSHNATSILIMFCSTLGYVQLDAHDFDLDSKRLISMLKDIWIFDGFIGNKYKNNENEVNWQCLGHYHMIILSYKKD